jgi:hypothetical protein
MLRRHRHGAMAIIVHHADATPRTRVAASCAGRDSNGLNPPRAPEILHECSMPYPLLIRNPLSNLGCCRPHPRR